MRKRPRKQTSGGQAGAERCRLPAHSPYTSALRREVRCAVIRPTVPPFPKPTFDYDYRGAMFETLSEERSRDDFPAYCRYYTSDHRPLWAEFAI
jgi:hypothetical protein